MSYQEWPTHSPQAAYVLGCAATYHTIFGTPLPPAWEEVAERDAVHRYGPPVLEATHLNAQREMS
jgi:hypothetical protein